MDIRLLQLEKLMGDKTTLVDARGIGSSTLTLPYCKNDYARYTLRGT